jgi:hypothetical protein
VVNTMTSLTGASGEDFASILRSLGYRMERRPKPRRDESARSEFAFRQACGAQGAARSRRQGAPLKVPAPARGQRIDKWLWHARVVRTRGAAAALADAGYVRVNGRASGRPAAWCDTAT